MTKRFSYILLLLMTLAATACDSDKQVDSVQDSFRFDMVTYDGYADGCALFTYLPRLDGKAIGYSAQMNKEPYIVQGQRVLLNYYLPAKSTPSSDERQVVKVKSFTPVITNTLRIADEARIDTMAREHIRLHSIWRTGKYINLHAEVEHTGKSRWFYLLADKATWNSDTIDCYLIHNTFGAQAYHWRKAYASYDISAAWNRPKCKVLRVLLNDEIAKNTHAYCFDKP